MSARVIFQPTLWLLALLPAMIACSDREASVQPAAQSSRTAAAAPSSWRALKSNLYINAQGEIGFLDFAAAREDAPATAYYLTDLDFSGKTKLAEVIDLDSFEQLGTSDFYRDKSHIYQHYAMLYGGRLSVFEEVEPQVDRDSFVVLNDFYARDRLHIYHHRSGWIRDADPASFATVGDSALARDRHRHYLHGEGATPEAAADYLKEICVQASTPRQKPDTACGND